MPEASRRVDVSVAKSVASLEVAVVVGLLAATASPSSVVEVVAEPAIVVASVVVSVVVKPEIAADSSPVEVVTVVAGPVVVTASLSVVAVVAAIDKLSDKPSLLVCVALFFELFVEVPVETLTESSVVKLSGAEVRPTKSVEVSLVVIETGKEVTGFGLQGLAKTSNECKAEAKQSERIRRRAIFSHNTRKHKHTYNVKCTHSHPAAGWETLIFIPNSRHLLQSPSPLLELTVSILERRINCFGAELSSYRFPKKHDQG